MFGVKESVLFTSVLVLVGEPCVSCAYWTDHATQPLGSETVMSSQQHLAQPCRICVLAFGTEL